MAEKRPPLSLQDLDARLRAARAKGGDGDRAKDGIGAGFALRIGGELVASLIVGVGIGWLLDIWLGTAPWLLVGFFFLGAGAGIVNVYRASMGMGAAVGWGADGADGADDAGEETQDRGGNGPDDGAPEN